MGHKTQVHFTTSPNRMRIDENIFLSLQRWKTVDCDVEFERNTDTQASCEAFFYSFFDSRERIFQREFHDSVCAHSKGSIKKPYTKEKQRKKGHQGNLVLVCGKHSNLVR